MPGCHLLFCLAIGGPSAAKVVAAHIHPIKTPQAAADPETFSSARATMLTGSPPPWLRKVLASAGVGAGKPDFEED